MKKQSKPSLVVSSRGQVTLPADLRKRLGIKDGGVVTVEERGGALVLRPAAVFEIEVYSDDQIVGWKDADSLTAKERSLVRKRFAKGA